MKAPTIPLQCLNAPERLSGKANDFTNVSVVEMQQPHFKWQQEQVLQQQQPPLSYKINPKAEPNSAFSAPPHSHHFQGDENLDGLLANAMTLEPGLGTSCGDFGSIFGGDFWGYGSFLAGIDMNSSFPRTLSCPPAVAAAMLEVATAAEKGKETVLPEQQSSTSKKRKAVMPLNIKVAIEDECKDKKLKGCTRVRDTVTKEQSNSSKNTGNNDNNRETSDTSKDKSKLSQVQKQDYIHVRARRGQATDSHSLAERVRREKISERMKYLQNLVPGCNKIAGKAGMLDEIINYVQSLQRQVEFLSMKLAAVVPGPDFNVDNYYTKEVFPASEALPGICLPPTYQPDAFQQAVSSSGLVIGVDPPMALKRSISAPTSIPGSVFESPCLSHSQSYSIWDAELQGILGMEFEQARSSLPSQQGIFGLEF